MEACQGLSQLSTLIYDWFRRIFSDSAKGAATAVASRPRVATTMVTAASTPSAPAPARTAHFASDSVTSMQRDQVDFIFASWLFEAESHPDIFTNGSEDAILGALDGVVKSNESGAHLVRRMPEVEEREWVTISGSNSR